MPLKIWIVIICLIPSLASAADPLVEKYMSRGDHLARQADCTGCHTAPGKPEFAGGLPVNSPFGTIYASNITPDSKTGIGDYTLKDFTAALRLGIAKDGHHLYPAMPYTSYSKISDEDIKSLYDYFMREVKPVDYKPPKTKLIFPFNQRWGLKIWNLFFASDERYKPNNRYDQSWNRGAYQVESLGHCGACHTARGIFFQEKSTSISSKDFLSGETLDRWASANLRGDKDSGLGNWSEDDIVAYLKTGHNSAGIVFGNMTEVITNSTQYMSDSDLHDIAHYLKSINSTTAQINFDPHLQQQFEMPGAGLYASACSACHQATGQGRANKFPALAGNPVVMSKDPTSLIRIVLEGSANLQIQNGPQNAKMPSFANLTDREIAEVVTYIRQSWGNDAPSVTTREVIKLREKLQQQSN